MSNSSFYQAGKSYEAIETGVGIGDAVSTSSTSSSFYLTGPTYTQVLVGDPLPPAPDGGSTYYFLGF